MATLAPQKPMRYEACSENYRLGYDVYMRGFFHDPWDKISALHTHVRDRLSHLWRGCEELE